MVLTLKQELPPLGATIEYEPYDTQEVEVLAMWVGEVPSTRVDIWPALSGEDQRAWQEVCLEDLEERRAWERTERAVREWEDR